MRTEKEIRQVAEHVVTLLPDDEKEWQQVLQHAANLKLWEDGRGPLAEGNDRSGNGNQTPSSGGNCDQGFRVRGSGFGFSFASEP